jgi:hypothetical protein
MTICLIWAKNFAGAVVIRIFVGGCEAMTIAAPLYLTFWYKSDELCTRTGIFFSVSALAGSFTGLISYALQRHQSDILAPWQFLFLVEGIMPVVFGIVTILLLPSVPEKLRLGFSDEERRMIINRTIAARNLPDDKVSFKKILQCFRTPHIYFISLTYVGILWGVSSFGNFLPSIVNGLGFDAVTSQLLTVPIWFLCFLSTILWSWVSDRYQLRGPIVSGLALFGVIGYIILVAVPTGFGARITGLCFIAIAEYPMVPLVLSWSAAVQVGYTERAVTFAFLNICGQLASLGSTYVYIDPPRYLKGNISVICLGTYVACVAFAYDIYLYKANQRKKRDSTSEDATTKRVQPIEVVGNGHPDFYYML